MVFLTLCVLPKCSNGLSKYFNDLSKCLNNFFQHSNGCSYDLTVGPFNV